MTAARGAAGFGRRGDFPPLGAGVWDAVDDLVEEFEAAWRSGGRPRIEEFLPRDPSGGQLLVELAHVELEFRRRVGEPAAAAEYLARFPDLAANAAAVEGLLTAERELGGSAAQVRTDAGATTAHEVNGVHAGAGSTPGSTATGAAPVVPGYEIVRELGRGGMGVVYEAVETRLGRRVALKTVSFGGTPDAAERLRREAAAAAALRHPNVAQVHQVFEHAGRVYVVGELVPGGTLAEASRGEPLGANQATDLLEPVARAVAYAHSLGIVHRDLKPSNVLIDADGTPKVGDFGLAKRDGDDSGLTRTGVIAGSPAYMAPEQAAGSKAVGPAADVWALGAILYELLTGRPPFRAATALETLELVRTSDPVPPSRLVPPLRRHRDVETVCLRCLEKDPAKRYPSAETLAQDLARFGRGEPVVARPVGRAGRAWRWARRNRAVAALLSLLALAVTAGLGGSLWQAARATRAATEATTNERYARRLLFASDMTAAAEAIKASDVARAAELLAEHEAERAGPYAFVWNHLDRLVRAPGGVFDRLGGPAFALAVSPDGRTLAAGGTPGEIRFYDASTRERTGRFAAGDAELRGLAFSADGARLAAAAGDGTVTLWDHRSGRRLWRKKLYDTWAYQAAFALGGSVLVACGHGPTIHLLDPATGEPLAALDAKDEAVSGLAVSPDGRTLFAAGYRGRASVWDLEARAERWAVDRVETGLRRLTSVAASPDGATAAFGSITAEVLLMRTDDRRVTVALPPTKRAAADAGGARAVAFLPDGRLAIGTDAGAVRLLEVTPTGFAAAGATGESAGRLASERSDGGPVLYLPMDDGDKLVSRDPRGDDVLSRNYNTGFSPDRAPQTGSVASTRYTGGEYVSVAYPATTAAIGVSLWFKATHPGAGLFSVTDTVSAAPHWNDPNVFLVAGHVAGQVGNEHEILTTPDGGYSDDRWHHVAYTYGPGVGQRLYVDGRLAAEGARSGPYEAKSGHARIGFSPRSALWGMVGLIDEVRVWDRPLDEEEVGLLAAGRVPPVTVPRAPDPDEPVAAARVEGTTSRLRRPAWVAHDDRVTSLAVAGDAVLSASRDGGLGAWRPDEAPGWVGFHEPETEDGSWRSAWLAPPGGPEWVAALGREGVHLFNTATHATHRIGVPGVRWESCAAAPDGRRFFAGAYAPGLLKAWDVRPAGLSPAWEWRPDVPCMVSPSAVPADGAWVAAWLEAEEDARFEDGTQHALVRLDAVAGRQIAFATFPNPLCRPAASADGTALAVGSHTAVVLLNPRTLAVGAEFAGHVEQVTGVAFAPDGRLLASCANDGNVFLWDVGRREAVRSWRADAAVTTSVAFSPDGRLLVTASDEHPPRVWDVETGRLLLEPGSAPYDPRGGEPNGFPAYFSADGTRVVAGSADLLTVFDGRPLRPSEKYVKSGMPRPTTASETAGEAPRRRASRGPGPQILDLAQGVTAGSPPSPEAAN